MSENEKRRIRENCFLVSAKATLQPGAGMGLYTASKAGLNALTASLAEEVKGQDITVNSVLPTIIDTPANRRDMPDANFTSWVRHEALAEIIFGLTQSWGSPIRRGTGSGLWEGIAV